MAFVLLWVLRFLGHNWVSSVQCRIWMKVQPKTCAQHSLESLQTVGEVSGRHKQRDSFDALLKVLETTSRNVLTLGTSR